MKVIHGQFRGKNRQATAIEKSINGIVKKHGFGLFRYVAQRMIEKERVRMQLEKKIRRAEQQLEELRKKA